MRRWPWLGLAVVSAVGFVTLARSTWIIWDGGYDLTVHVEASGTPVRAVDAQAFTSREVAEQAATHLRTETGRWATTADPFDGRPLAVSVRTSGADSFFGWEVWRAQYRFLVVVVTYADGRRAAKLIDIPDGRVSREVRVRFD